jgi:phosphatidylglycerophosphate synthase
MLREPLGLTYSMIAYVALWVAAGLTVYTGYVYFRAGVVHVRPQRAPDSSAGGRV